MPEPMIPEILRAAMEQYQQPELDPYDLGVGAGTEFAAPGTQFQPQDLLPYLMPGGLGRAVWGEEAGRTTPMSNVERYEGLIRSGFSPDDAENILTSEIRSLEAAGPAAGVLRTEGSFSRPILQSALGDLPRSVGEYLRRSPVKALFTTEGPLLEQMPRRVPGTMYPARWTPTKEPTVTIRTGLLPFAEDTPIHELLHLVEEMHLPNTTFGLTRGMAKTAAGQRVMRFLRDNYKENYPTVPLRSRELLALPAAAFVESSDKRVAALANDLLSDPDFVREWTKALENLHSLAQTKPSVGTQVKRAAMRRTVE